MSPLFTNAINSIRVGLEDFESSNPARMVSAIRNLYSGLLLLAKEKLRQMSPPDSREALIFKNVVPQLVDGEIVWVGMGKKTVDFEEIQQRFRALGLPLEWSRLEKLRELRNALEHHSSAHPDQVLKEAISNTQLLVLELVESHLGLVPREVLGEEAWKRVLNVAEAFREVERRCVEARGKIVGGPSGTEEAIRKMKCPDCSSSLIRPTAEAAEYSQMVLVCESCGEQSTLEAVMIPAIHATHGPGYDWHEGPSLGVCPTCNEETFLATEDHCLLCGESRPYKTCLRCNADLQLDEADSGLCGYCQHMMGRDD